ncbi:CobW family GTP-binding protein [Paragemmobacter straminiformis]|uniref:GTP-binding protein n=1 Tax=Paragemmobacter straminiformis TaxID=2045119 RepID=A0A842IA33_9RHOB|nr:CobW family GTP-binding protein [Gemmobacter straminiformis]MBC2836495.1 GTP-binding protein [Gemmobacter straminiformis]
MTSDTRLRLTLLGGYLGSGKTTWLRHQLHVGAFGPRVHVVVNEAAETPVDDALLAGAEGMTLLAGGCCCCAGRAELIAALRRLCDARSRISAEEARLERIVLETSGLADPGAIVAAIQDDPVLVNHIVVEETVVAVDALHALAQLATEPLGRRQVGAADRMVLTKTDACAPDALATLRATLAGLNGHATLSAAVLGVEAVLAPLPAGARPAVLPELAGEDARGPIAPTQLALPDDLDWSAFTLWLSALLHARGDDLVRVKGVLRTPAGRLLLQTVRKVVQSPEILPEQGESRSDNVIVFIGRGYRPEDLGRSMRRFLSPTRTT